MSISLNTRKPVDELQPADFAAFPIWEFAIDEEEIEDQDETWVRPLAATLIEPDLYSLSVAAQFITASGHSIMGFLGVTTALGMLVSDVFPLKFTLQVLLRGESTARQGEFT
jgi:hypothetical protein